ncbi:MAG: CRTAC1 family protein [Actinomycetota bacterium]|nr:CRTAC1 family protein [Actinomycetota bacterium]
MRRSTGTIVLLTLLLALGACLGGTVTLEGTEDPAARQAGAGEDPHPSPPPQAGEGEDPRAGEGEEPPATEAGEGEELAGCWSAPIEAGSGPGPVAWENVTRAAGLWEPLLGMRGHALAWGDVDGDGWADVFVGTFADEPTEDYQQRGAEGPAPDRLLLGGPDGFVVDESFPTELGRTSGAAFADLDGDADLDLVVARNSRDRYQGPGTQVLRNHQGAFEVASVLSSELGARSVGVLDYDGDGLLDLFIAEDRWTGGSSVLLRNEGELRFRDVTRAAGLPADVDGLGVGVADLTGDRWPDLFVAGSNRLFVNSGEASFREADSSVFSWETYGDEDDVAGVAIADLNRDGLPDIVLGQHYNSTVDDDLRVPVRLYLHQGVAGGSPQFEDVTEEAGLPGLPTKAPHVEVGDFDNDGWPDILTTASAEGGTLPAIFRHLGTSGGLPSFATPEGLGAEQYWVTAGSSDVDHDGRLDVMLVEWEPGRPTLLLGNDTLAGHWLSLEPGAIGAVVEVYEEGMLGDPGALLGSRQVVASHGYGSGSLASAHFGLGGLTEVDVRVSFPHGAAGGGDPLELSSLGADQRLSLPGNCPPDQGAG